MIQESGVVSRMWSLYLDDGYELILILFAMILLIKVMNIGLKLSTNDRLFIFLSGLC